MLRHRKIKIQLLLILLISIIPFLLFIFYLFDLWYDTSRSAILDHSITQSRLIAQYINDSIASDMSNAIILSAEPIINKLKEDDKEGTLVLKNMVTNQPKINAVNVLGPNGKLIISSLPIDPDHKDVSAANRDYFQTAVKTKKPNISDPLTGLITGKSLVIMAAPILKNGEVTGVVTTSYDLAYLKKSIEKMMANNDKTTVILLDRTGQIIFMMKKPFPTTDAVKKLLVGENFVRQALDGKISTIENWQLPGITTEPSVGASVTVENLGWVVISLQPTSNIFAPLLNLEKVIWLIILSAAVFAFALISLFLRRVKIIY